MPGQKVGSAAACLALDGKRRGQQRPGVSKLPRLRKYGSMAMADAADEHGTLRALLSLHCVLRPVAGPAVQETAAAALFGIRLAARDRHARQKLVGLEF